MSVMNLTDDNFKEKVIEASKTKPVLIDFYATWCGPCKMFSPVIDEYSDETKDVSVGKMNVDENKGTAADYGIMSIPTVKLFKDGKVIAEFRGFKSKQQVDEWVKEKLK